MIHEPSCAPKYQDHVVPFISKDEMYWDQCGSSKALLHCNNGQDSRKKLLTMSMSKR
jgi:hypothetical protein